MKTIGLLGGMSWESSLEYYRIINETMKKRIGEAHSAKCFMYSFDFAEIEELQHAGKWTELTEQMVNTSAKIKNAGADFLVICTNTMHMMAPEIEESAKIKVLHIVDVTGEKINESQMKRVALLGTKFTMESDFYKQHLIERYGIDVIIPEEEDREAVHQIIYDELVKGIVTDESKDKYIAIIERLAQRGAEGVILGCTEIPLLIKQEDVSIPVFDTTQLHAEAAVDYALQD
ncbi:aspartate/glutamate racemase family protein [Rubeoparvulum massiliense]|uniref:aspartate/glutamate racemase family protein n=1 Tax=Rubeoparvulum massiliense TaxID=1631346 RepID=UPI00065E65F5|nr:aspartate/glutamate racemase family protein [Rubeoparvulum massiliense]